MKFSTRALRTLAIFSMTTSSSLAFTSSRRTAPFVAANSQRLFGATTSGTPASFPTWTFDAPCTTMEWNSLHNVTLTLTTTPVTTNDLMVIGVYNKTLTGMAKTLDESTVGALSELMNLKSFTGKAGTMSPTVRISEKGQTTRYALIGLSSQDAAKDGSKLGSALAKAITEDVVSCSVILPETPTNDANLMLSDFSSSLYSALYKDFRYKAIKEDTVLPGASLQSIQLVLPAESAVTDDTLTTGQYMASGIVLTKDIVNAPHNVLNSLSLAETAERLASSFPAHLKCRILNADECQQRGMGAFLGVARGSETEPKFIHLTYTPSDEPIRKVGIVGKGLLFDTGGYNIKTQMMELMKFDCGGAAAVLGAAKSIAQLQPKGVEVHFIIAACENMINEKAMVPSDVLTASNGKTIEIVNTDAEGRLTLADALVYADVEVGCEKIIELSTLTGACMISLGKGMAGVWTSNDDLAAEIEESSKKSGDKTWRMPLEDSYNDQLKSKIADLTNCGTKYGGAITAALFLQNFVDKEKPFAHIDIAGPVWNDKTGATGYGAKLVTEWVMKQGE